MVLDWFAFGVQQIIEANEKCVTFIIETTVNCSLSIVHFWLSTVRYLTRLAAITVATIQVTK